MIPRHYLRPILILIPVLCAGLLLAGCGDDDGDVARQVTLADFAGTWESTSYRATAKDNPETTMDLIPLGGMFGFQADEQGGFRGMIHVPEVLGGPFTVPFQGALSLILPDTLVIDFDEEDFLYIKDTQTSFQLEANGLTLREEYTTFDFGAGEVPATFEGTFARRGAVTLADFEGDWAATMYLVQSVAHAERVLELMALGGTFEFSADAAGAFSGSMFIPAALAGTDTTITFQGDVTLVSQTELRVDIDQEVEPFLTGFTGDMLMLGSMVMLVDDNATFDFGMGEEAAVATVIVVM